MANASLKPDIPAGVIDVIAVPNDNAWLWISFRLEKRQGLSTFHSWSYYPMTSDELSETTYTHLMGAFSPGSMSPLSLNHYYLLQE